MGGPPLHQRSHLDEAISGIWYSGLSDKPKSGRPRTYGLDVDTEVNKAAAARPKDLGLPFTTWSLPKLQEYLKMPSQRRFCDDSTKATRFHQPDDGDNRMNENDEDVEHAGHGIKSQKIPEFRPIL
jgi:hypothetical protein